MINFEKILYPVDLSAQSRAVAPSVAAMAKRFDSEVVLLHVSGAATPVPELDRFAAAEFSGIPVVREMVEGDPAQQIVSYADEHQVDLIMMPTHGHGPFRALLLGSVTAKVLHDTHCLVWTGVHTEEMTAHSPDRWKRILCAIETDEHGESVLKWAWEFAQQQSLELQLVHAVAGADSMWTEASDPSMYEFLFHAAREQLAKLQVAAGTNLETRLIGGSVGSAVHQAAVDYDADLIVIGRGAIQTSFGRLRNNDDSIIRAAPCPVISI
ncbi:MAG: universal stress protein [Acidobacteriia bacterium]|nr:universal stress protein [Terriglobia bacterium]